MRSNVVAETSLYAVFRKTEPFEKELNKDASEFTRDEMQHIQMKFVPEIEAGWGFRVHEQAIYIDKDDVVSYEVDDGRIIINGNRMTIKIISRS